MGDSRKPDVSQRQELVWLLDEADSAIESWWQTEEVRWPEILTKLVSRLRLCGFDLEAEGIASDVQVTPKGGMRGCRNRRELRQLRQRVVERVRKRIAVIRKVVADEPPAAIYRMKDEAYSIMSERRSREKIASGADTETDNAGKQADDAPAGTEQGEGEDDKPPAPGGGVSFDSLASTIPAIDEGSSDWISNKCCANLLGVKIKTLANHRDKGEKGKAENESYGLHGGYCFWRKIGNAHPRYYAPLMKDNTGHLGNIYPKNTLAELE